MRLSVSVHGRRLPHLVQQTIAGGPHVAPHVTLCLLDISDDESRINARVRIIRLLPAIVWPLDSIKMRSDLSRARPSSIHHAAQIRTKPCLRSVQSIFPTWVEPETDPGLTCLDHNTMNSPCVYRKGVLFSTPICKSTSTLGRRCSNPSRPTFWQ